jgi:uncharacterized membrane protein YidH (DUF202 family)
MSYFDRRTPPPPPRGDDDLPPPQPLPPSKRSGCLTVLMVIFGIVLLLPGLCATLFSTSAILGGQFRQVLDGAPLIIIGLVVGFAGIMLILHATRES